MISQSTVQRVEIASGQDEALPNVYKQSEVGSIPNDWEPCSVGSMGNVVAGKALAVRGAGRQRPYLRTKNVFDGRIDLADVLFMPMTDEQFATYQVHQGDVLLNEGQSLELVGRCSIYKGEYHEHCAIQNQLVRFRARDGVSPEFAAHLFRHCQQTGVFARISLQTTSIAHLGVSRFQRLLLPWPREKHEQRAIAAALSDVDELIGALDKLIAKKRAIKLATMQQLLTGKTRLPGFAKSEVMNKTEIGVVPSDWSVKPLSSAIEGLDAGVSVRSVNKANGNSAHGSFILKTSAVEDGCFLSHECKAIDPRDTSRAKLNPRADTILISRMNTIALVGECGYVDRDYPHLFVPDRLWMTRFRSDSGISARWLSYMLTSRDFRQKLKSIATGTSGSMKNIAMPALLGLFFAFPNPEEQRAVATVFADMDAEIATLEQRREKTKAIKQGMMQSLLTGRIRLVEPEAEDQS